MQPSLHKGFTLIETLVAISILTLTVGAMLSLTATSYFSVRYSRNDIVASNLAQEALEYLRNNRDGALTSGTSWNTWTSTLIVDTTGSPATGARGCFGANGCFVDPYTTAAHVIECSGTCPNMYFYPNNGFYGYMTSYPFSGDTPYQTSFVRTVTAHTSPYTSDEIIVTATVSWLNGTFSKSFTRSMILANWRP